MWIAGKRMKLKRAGVYIDVMPGDPVPEASFWNRRVWIRQGFIKEVPDLLSVEVETDLDLVEAGVSEEQTNNDVFVVSLQESK